MKEKKTFTLKIFRGHPGKQYWEEFELELKSNMNVISALMLIQKNPITADEKKVAPVAWESGCLEEVCGSCSILVNGRPRQACTTLIEPLLNETGLSTITLAPLSKFPLIRDLVVDRDSMFENLKKISAWIEVDDVLAESPGPKISQAKQEAMYVLSTCMTCGCCQEACPQINKHSKFLGPQTIGQVQLFNINPKGRFQKSTRLHVMMEEGGVGDCGNAQNCVVVCPKKLPLTDAIASVCRDTTIQAVADLFSLPEREVE